MFDSLPYRTDAAIVFRRLARSLPQRQGIVGVIHEATYPPRVRDAYYGPRQTQATRAGLTFRKRSPHAQFKNAGQAKRRKTRPSEKMSPAPADRTNRHG